MEVTWRRIGKQHLHGNEAISNYDNDVTTNYAAAAVPERALHRHSTARMHELPITTLDVVTWLLASREHRSRDFSPHMSPDRVTRNISPGRQQLREQNLEVRVPSEIH